MDGQMSEEIRIGILVRVRMNEMVSEAARAFLSIPGNEGKSAWPMWRRKDGSGVAMSFGSTLLEEAGGIDRLFAGWVLDCGK